MGFPDWPKICALSQRWRQGQIFGQPAVCGSRLQVHFPGGNQAQVPGGTGKVRSHLPSTRRFLVSNSCHLGTDWTSGSQWAGRRCVKPHSRGFGVLKGNARTRMLPANLDHLRVERRKQGTCETAWVTPGHDCLCPCKYGHGAAVRPQTDNAIWNGLLVCGAGSHPSYHLGVVIRMCQSG